MAHLSKLSRNKRTEIQKMRLNEQHMRTIKNKKRRIQRHLSLQPKDIQALAALKRMLQ